MSTDNMSDAKKNVRRLNTRLKREREQRGWTQNELAERVGSTQVNVSRWEHGDTVPGPYFRQKLAELFGKSIEQLGFIASNTEEQQEEAGIPIETASPRDALAASLLWNVPHRRNFYFTGREDVLAHLYTVLNDRKAAALNQAQAISGLGGIGKTQIAVEYAYRYRKHYQAVFWINASSHDAFSADFVALTTLLSLPEQRDQDQDIVVRAVKRWLSSDPHWLLILDNLDSLRLIDEFLPPDAAGDVLITTRQQALGTIAQSIEVEKMEKAEGVKFLLRRAKLLGPDTAPDQLTPEQQAQATEIVSLLDGLPLALDQAGAYIEETRCGLSHYLDLYATRRKELLSRRGRLPVDHPEPVATTWSLSFQKAAQESATAADLLRLLAFLGPEAIPEEIITADAMLFGSGSDTAAIDPLKVNEAIEILLRYSLIWRNPKEHLLNIHRLVQAVLRDTMDKDTQSLWAERAIRAVNTVFPDVELKTWDRCRRCIPHVLECASYAEAYALTFPKAARLFNEAASYLIVRAGYEQAELLLLKALVIRQQILEAHHPAIAQILNDLGVLYLNQGKYREAEVQLQMALAIRQQVLGETHPDLAQTLYDLANLYRTRGIYTKAEPLYLDALHIRENLPDIDSLLLAQSYYGLAKLYYSMEQYEQAKKFCGQALHIREKRLGNEHFLIATTLNLLAKIYQGQNVLDRAEVLNLRALLIREHTSGPDHPHVAVILNSLIEIYHAEGRFSEVDPLIARSLRIQEQSLGPEHPYLAYSLTNKAAHFFLLGNYIQAESYYKKAMIIREQRLGLDHPRTASTYRDLAQLYDAWGKSDESESFYKKALSARENAFGRDNLAVVSLLKQYASFLNKLKREREASELEARLQAIGAKNIASESP